MKTRLSYVLLILLLMAACNENSIEDEFIENHTATELQQKSILAIDQEITKQDYNLKDSLYLDYKHTKWHPISGTYYYPNTDNKGNLPLIIINHGDGYNKGHFEGLARDLALEGFFVATIDKYPSSASFIDEDNAYHKILIQKHIIGLYKLMNGEHYSTTSWPMKDPGSPSLIGKDILLIGHSAGGSGILHRGEPAVSELQGALSLKAIIGIAPTFNKVYGQYPQLTQTPFFIIQGNKDTDGGDENKHYSLDNDFRGKVGYLENGALSGSVERAYILVPGGHGIASNHNSNDARPDVSFYCQAIAKKFLKNNTTDFNDYIREQNFSDYNGKWSNILYWNDADDIYYRATNTGYLPNGMLYATRSSEGLVLEEKPANLLLGSTAATKNLHWSDVLTVKKENVVHPGIPPVKTRRTLRFTFSENVSITKSKLRFNAGKLYNFDIETYNDDTIDPAIRLVYPPQHKYDTTNVSNWVQMSDMVCGAINSAEFGNINPTESIERNIMNTYVVDLSVFDEAPAGASIVAVEFDFSDTIGEKTLVLDDLGFMD